MGKSLRNKKKFQYDWNLGTYRFRKKFLLLKHLKDTQFKISRTMANALMDEEIRNKDAIINDLEPTIIPENVYSVVDNEGRSITSSFTPTDSSESSDDMDSGLLESFAPTSTAGDSNSKKPIINNTNKNNDTHNGSNHVEFSLPSITELEESGLREFYNSFLNSASWQISNLNVKPGDSHFIFWFIVSSYIPLICSCSGPLSNVFSLLAIICPWKINKLDPSFEHDPFWCYLVNSISIVFALFSNIFLLLNYRRKVRYTYCQIISIFGWSVACCILTVLIIVYHVWFYAGNYNEKYIIGEGFWFAVITVVFHFINFLLLLLNESGFLLKKYKPVFNIDEVQQTLIIQTTAMGVWLIIGASVFTRFLNFGLGDSFYYCIVSVVTIGYQDVVSTSNVAAQTLTSIWIIFGLVMFGLIVTSIRQMMLDFSTSTLYWHRIESLRRNLLKFHEKEKRMKPTNRDSFELIKNIHKWAYTIQGVIELATSIVIFMVTLMCGALAISILENWAYKTTVYFCFFNLMTLGQGNQIPTTPGGKAFFCAWGLAAIPVMTILVSTSSDFVFSKLTMYEEITFIDAFIEYCLTKKYLRKIGYFLKERKNVTLDVKNVSLMRTKSMIKIDDENNNDFIRRSLELTNLNPQNEYIQDYDNLNTNDENEFKGKEIDDTAKNEGDRNKPNFVSKSSHSRHDLLTDVPISCHPADMLYNVILDSNGLDNYEFINSQSFVRSNTAAIQLANYFREGKTVNPNVDQLRESRHVLGQKFKDLDEKFDIDEYEKIYDINVSKNNSSVIKNNNIIMTNFKKKNDFILTKLSRIQIILLQLRDSLHKVCNDPDHKYSYEDWEILFKVTQNEEALNDDLYWIEQRSPLALPMNQPKYFVLHYLRHLELFIQQFAAEWDEMPNTVQLKPNYIPKMSKVFKKINDL